MALVSSGIACKPVHHRAKITSAICKRRNHNWNPLFCFALSVKHAHLNGWQWMRSLPFRWSFYSQGCWYPPVRKWHDKVEMPNKWNFGTLLRLFIPTVHVNNGKSHSCHKSICILWVSQNPKTARYKYRIKYSLWNLLDVPPTVFTQRYHNLDIQPTGDE